MSDTAKDVVAKSEFWIRVNLALEVCVKEALINILQNIHNDPSYKGLPTDPADLYQYMSRCKGKPTYRILKADQWALLCPANGRSNPREWDITLIVFVIRNETTLKPVHGWSKDKPPPSTDITKGGCVDHAKYLRNDLNHGSVDAISTQPQFDRYWDRIKRILTGLGYQNMAKFHELKTASLDKYNGEIFCLVTTFNKDLKALKGEASDNTNKIQKTNAKIDMCKQTIKSEVKKIEEKMEIYREEIENNKHEIKEIKDKLPEKKTQEPLYWDLREPVANFYGRQDIIKDIEDKLHQSSTVVISAMGGCGKTQTVAKFVQTNKHEYDSVLWISASNLQKSLAMISRQLLGSNDYGENSSVLELAQKIKQLTRRTKVLYIVDNVLEDNLKDLGELMRNCGSENTRILITTQLSQIPSDQIMYIYLQNFTEIESETFLQENLTGASDVEIKKLSSELGNFPLCLQQAVCYIKNHGTEISLFISNFKKCRKSILDPKGTFSDYDKTLLTVWDFAFEKLKESPKALKILAMLALMDNSCIKKETFLYDEDIAEDEIEMNEIVDVLCEYSLIQQNKHQLYIHSLTQKVIAIKMTNFHENPKTFLQELLERIASKFEEDEFHNDEDDLWFIHYRKLFINVDNVDSVLSTLANFNLGLIEKLTINRFDFGYIVNHFDPLLEAAKHIYLSNKPFWLFLSMLRLKTQILHQTH